MVREVTEEQLQKHCDFLNAVLKHAFPDDSMLARPSIDVDSGIDIIDRFEFPFYLVQASFTTVKSIGAEKKVEAWDLFEYVEEYNYPHAPNEIYEKELETGLRNEAHVIRAVLAHMYQNRINGFIMAATSELYPETVDYF